MLVLVYEIGGTSIRAGLYDPAAHAILRERRAETPNFQRHPDLDAEGLLDRLGACLAALAAGLGAAPGAAVGIAYPGPTSPDGVALASPTLLGGARDRPVDVASLARRALGGGRVTVMNDVTACGYRYVAEGLSDFCLVNVGSGIGNKLFLAGRAVVGPGGRGGELGHFAIDPRPDAPLCDCGGRGHLAGIASGRGTERLARAAAAADPAAYAGSLLARTVPEPAALATTDIVAAFHAGDGWTRARIGEAARPLAQAIAGIFCMVGVERFVLVGGFAQALGEGYRRLLAELCAAAAWDLGQDWDRMLTLGESGDRDGLLGLGYAVGRV